MKRVGLLAILTAFLVVGAVGINRSGSAQEFKTGDTVTVSQNQKINSTLYTSGRFIDIAGEIDGDVFCAGQTVNITAVVHGDVICAAQTIHINGPVDGDVRAAGQTVAIGGAVKGNVSVLGQGFTLESGSSVAGDVSTAAETSTISGRVGRDIAVAAGAVTIGGDVGRNVKASTSKLMLLAASHVRGRIDYTGAKPLDRSAGAVVDGPIKYTAQKPDSDDRSADFALGLLAYVLVAGTIIALTLALLLPRFLHSLTDSAVRSPWLALLTGFVASIVFPVLFIVLMLTFFGIPLALVLGVAWLLIVLLSGPVSAYYLGRLLLRNSRRPVLIMLVGSLVLLTLYFVPILGFIIFLLAIWLGIGMILLGSRTYYVRPVYALPEDKPIVSKRKAS